MEPDMFVAWFWSLLTPDQWGSIGILVAIAVFTYITCAFWDEPGSAGVASGVGIVAPFVMALFVTLLLFIAGIIVTPWI